MQSNISPVPTHTENICTENLQDKEWLQTATNLGLDSTNIKKNSAICLFQ